MYPKWLFTLAALLIVSTCTPRASRDVDEGDAASELQAQLHEAVGRGIPGISAAVATRDGVIWTGVAGEAVLQTAAPLRSDMLFGIGSITKTFVAVVILQLVDEGRVDLNATPADLLGTAVENIPNADKATIAELLNHTGGVPSWEDDPSWIHDGRGDRLDVNRIWGKTATLQYIMNHAPLADPGERFSYANTNFTLLGMIIEKVTGQEVIDKIHRRIRKPLGLHDIYLEGFEFVPPSRLPHRYHWATAAFRHDAGVNQVFPEVRSDLIDVSRSNLSVEWVAGGMVATARDLALYAVALRDGRLLSSHSMELLTDWSPAGEGWEVGHNLFRKQFPDGGAIVVHYGDVLGFTGALYWVEGVDTVVAVLCNVGSMHSGEVTETAYSVAERRKFVDLAVGVATSK